MARKPNSSHQSESTLNKERGPRHDMKTKDNLQVDTHKSEVQKSSTIPGKPYPVDALDFMHPFVAVHPIPAL